MTHITFQVSYKKFLNDLIYEKDARDYVISCFEKFYKENKKCVLWEFPPYSEKTIKNLAEFVLLPCNNFPPANKNSFEQYLTGDDNSIVNFYNLSKDAMLLCPQFNDKHQFSGNIMDFMLNGDLEQKHNLLKAIGKNMLELSTKKQKIYLSTHGFGVPWLHIRLCDKPKYYLCDKYKSM